MARKSAESKYIASPKIAPKYKMTKLNFIREPPAIVFCQFNPLRLLRRNLIRRLHHFVDELFEILQSGGGHDDGVAPPADVLGDAKEPAAWIFLEREDEGLALDLNLLRFQRLLVGRRPGLAVGPLTERRWSFVRD